MLFLPLQLVDIDDDGFLSLMKDDGDIRSDVKLPDNDIGKEIQTKFDKGESILVTILKAMGTEAAIATKADTTNK